MGSVIRGQRERLRLTQPEVAERASLHRSVLDRIEHDRIERPAPGDLAALARALDLSAADLFILAGYASPHDLPSFSLYLRLRYNLSAKELQRLEAVFKDVIHERAA